MRLSQLLITTLRDDPSDAEVPSHRLLARGGYIVKVASGIYTYSPLMWRTIKKVRQIVIEELDRAGAQEMMMPIAQPKELWEASGRWDRMTAEGLLFVLKDRKGSDLCLGPTHEEVVTHFADQMVSSYKQLPVNLYQVQDKFRDEIRARFGLMRSREFIMMDAYSFDVDDAGLDVSYDKMKEAYHAVFKRCKLNYSAVQADAGAIGGSGSEEFHVLADTGEDAILNCTSCDYAANAEKADSKLATAPDAGDPKPLEKHETPEIRSVEQLCEFFKMPAIAMAKTLVFTATFADRDETVAVMMRGDLELNEVKLVNALDCLAVKMTDDATIAKVLGVEPGFCGPIDLPEDVRLLADIALKGQTNLLTGCNETGYHNLNVNPGRDCREPEYIDLHLARAGEGCPECDGTLEETRGIEVGHIFKLGTKYSASMESTFMNEQGKPAPFVMGCYGIGVTRTAQAAVEQNHDDKGIIWPAPLAPFEVVVAIVDVKKPELVELGEKIYADLKAAGIDACLDDRKMRPGVKFKDIELLGFPVQVNVGKKATEGIVEFMLRREGEKHEVAPGDVLARCQAFLAE